MGQVRDAFNKVKQDIFYLREEIKSIKNKISQTDRKIYEIYEILSNLRSSSTYENALEFQTDTPIIPTEKMNLPTDNTLFGSAKPNNLTISIGNKGVPTDRQTDRQTDKK